MTILSPTNLETDTYNQAGWVHIFNSNIDKLNDVLLKIQALQDVNTDSLVDGSILTWDATASKWKTRYYG